MCATACAAAVPAWPPLPVNTPISIITATGDFVRNDNTSSLAYTGSGGGTTAAEQYTAVNPSNPTSTSPIQPGHAALLFNKETGKFCRLQPLATNMTQIGMVCDLPSPSGATPLTYTGNGLSTSTGVPLVASGPGQPLLLANTTASQPGPNDAVLYLPQAPPLGERHVAVIQVELLRLPAVAPAHVAAAPDARCFCPVARPEHIGLQMAVTVTLSHCHSATSPCTKVH
jgi:hypothetical protein